MRFIAGNPAFKLQKQSTAAAKNVVKGREQMQIVTADSKLQKKKYLAFRHALYRGDEAYVCTSEFVVENFLYQTTAFARSCSVQPVMVLDNGIAAQCMLIHHSRLNLMQIAFFEALPDQQAAVDILLQYAKTEARRIGVPEIIVGLNGHISCGVGILTEGFHKISFDSNYNKPYYADYFAGMQRKEGCSTYRGLCVESMQMLCVPNTSITVRTADMKHYEEEMELFRSLCDRTLGTTNLYFPTDERHFYELTKDLKAFLKPENILFAMSGTEAVGFLFWHPDFNQVLRAGRKYSLAGIGWQFLSGQKRIDTVKINAIGVLPEYQGTATVLLLDRMAQYLGNRFRFYETTFVWDNNEKSTRLNQHFVQSVYRKYAVYFDKVNYD